MGADKIGRSEDAIRPPRWTNPLLRTFQDPEETEPKSGDLLEAFRDSISRTRGGLLAGVRYVLQAAGSILRARGLKLRNCLLAGFALCVLATVFSALLYPGLLTGSNAAIVAAGLLFYGYAAVWRTRPRTSEDAVVLGLGARYGVAIGALWIAAYIGLNLGVAVGIGPALFAFLLPFVAGAHAAIKLWSVKGGMRVGFWSGLTSGLMVFLAWVAMGYILAFVPGLPGAEIPANHFYTAAEFERLNVGNSLGGGLFHLFVLGGIFSSIGGAGGGLVGILVARGGRGPEVSRRML